MSAQRLSRSRWLAALLLLAGLVVASDARGHDAGRQATQPRVAFVIGAGCADPFEHLLCVAFKRAARLTGVTGRIISPSAREDPADTLELLAKQRYDLVVVFGFQYYEPLGEAARRQPGGRFAILDTTRSNVAGSPRNVQGVVFRTSEAAYLAGWLAARLERERRGRDTVGVVAGVKLPSVDDFVIGFRAGTRRVSPGIRLLVAYSRDFVDPTKCNAIAHRQIARGAGVVFNVAGACGLGTLAAAEESGVWGVGVDTDQSFLGPHILTSVVKHYDAGLVILLRQVRAGRLTPGRDTVLTLREGAVGLGKISPQVPASLRKELDRLRGRIARGAVRVPGAFPDPR
jgi:basic membrane protein A